MNISTPTKLCNRYGIIQHETRKSVRDLKYLLDYPGGDLTSGSEREGPFESCKGKGGCKSSDNGCKGKNSCKGKGGCATDGSKPPADDPKQ